jgi:hypothetical protein
MPAHPAVARLIEFARSEGVIPPSEKDAKRSGRIHRTLLDAANRRTGLTSETALLEYAFAKVAIEDDIVERLNRLRGTVSQDIDLEF